MVHCSQDGHKGREFVRTSRHSFAGRMEFHNFKNRLFVANEDTPISTTPNVVVFMLKTG